MTSVNFLFDFLNFSSTTVLPSGPRKAAASVNQLSSITFEYYIVPELLPMTHTMGGMYIKYLF